MLSADLTLVAYLLVKTRFPSITILPDSVQCLMIFRFDRLFEQRFEFGFRVSKSRSIVILIDTARDFLVMLPRNVAR